MERKWEVEMDKCIKLIKFRMQYRDILDDGHNWVKQLFYY